MLKKITKPTLAISLTEAKDHLRIDGSDHDTYLKSLIRAVTQKVEEYTGNPMVLTTYEEYLDTFPSGCITLSRGPVRVVDSIKYTDQNGSEQTLSTSNYVVSNKGLICSIARAENTSWPSVINEPDAVKITYRAGHAVGGSFSGANYVLTNHWFSANDPIWLSNTGGALPSELSEDTTYYVIVNDANNLSFSATSGGSDLAGYTSPTGTNFLYNIPEDIKAGALLILGYLYENGADTVKKMPTHAEWLLNTYRINILC